MACCIEKSSIFAAAFGKCIYKVSNIQYYFNQKNMNYSCRKTIVPIIIGTLLSGACSNDEPTGGKGHQQTYSVVLKGITVAGEESSEELKDVSVFQFSDGNLYKEEQLTPGKGGQSEISAVSGSRLYFLTGLEIPAGEKAKSEEEFRNTIIGEGLHDNSAPDFMAAVVELESGVVTRSNAEVNVIMKRGVARIDLNTTADSKTQIKEVIVENAPAETLPFLENVRASDKTVSYRKEFSSAFDGKQEGVFRLFESTRPVNIILRGTYGEVPIRLKVELPVVERNKVYELAVLNVGAEVTGVFEIKPWEEGETIVGKPDTNQRLLLNASKSRIPEGVKVDYENNILEVPATGADDMTLAFVTDTRIDISSTEGAGSGTSVGNMSVSEEAEGIVSSFNVSVAAQGSGRLGYTVLVHLKNALLSGTYDYVEIRVAPSDKQIETVEIAGNVWMAFNARSRDLEDQIYPLDGATVEDMYHKSWINTVGGLFQFGRLYMYVPWQGYNPSNNLGNQTADAPWVNDTHMPCPEGYRIPTGNEWQSLLPADQEIPGRYKAGNGETIAATLHIGEGTLITPSSGVTGTQHYVKFTSEDTGRSLIIPLAGSKGDKSSSNNPAFGKRAVLWTNERNGLPGGYAWAYWLPFEGAETAVIKKQRLQMEAFASVRCVKK